MTLGHVDLEMVELHVGRAAFRANEIPVFVSLQPFVGIFEGFDDDCFLGIEELGAFDDDASGAATSGVGDDDWRRMNAVDEVFGARHLGFLLLFLRDAGERRERRSGGGGGRG